ncbi:hypothetical protein DPMN_104382 [Dreissena polymorpha]|uniref:Very-long-chain (3R)-3-hydroxyacyl-CoA dehydratase n=2 Tax=Dreissena polymorpha TaxID=45954 RepID=A0A9D4HBH2_DREPO|nr:hypothetical protein DPMN_104382 [Dreissena polymorpha]
MADVLKPFVYWGQKEDSISLKVDLRDVKVDKADITEDKLTASFTGVGAHGNKQYEFDLEFYLPIDKWSCKQRTTARGVEFSIKKQGAEAWPRLTKSQTKLAWLKIDFDKFVYEDDIDSEDERDKMAADEVMRNLEKQLEDEKKGEDLNVSGTYLFTYNMLQFVGFLYITTVLSYNFLKHGAGAKEKAFELVGTQMMFCQATAVLEIIHPLIGLVKTGVVAPVMQVGGRGFILFLLILQDVRLQIAPVVWYLFMTWSAVELVRYPFYMLSSIGKDIKVISWLRYSAWIPLYPLGILFEATVVIMSIPLFEESGMFSVQLPNASNMAFYFPWFLHTYLLILALGGIQMMKHMYILRKKKLGISTPSKKLR